MSWEKLTLGRYHLIEKIGRGGFGEVYRAIELDLDRQVAVKILTGPEDIGNTTRQKLLERFGQEARIIARLDHYNILPIFAYDQYQGTPYLVMPLMAKSLSQRLRAGPVSLEEIVYYTGQVAAGLQYAHDQNIIHRDIKPPNILMSEDEKRVVVADFGIARILSGLNDMTQTSIIIGSPLYMAPEQALGMVGRKSDIYSLGLTVYEMVTKTLPREHAFKPLLPPSRFRPEVSPAMDAVVLKALEKDPDRRYEQVEEFAGELQMTLEAMGRTPFKPGRPARKSNPEDITQALPPPPPTVPRPITRPQSQNPAIKELPRTVPGHIAPVPETKNGSNNNAATSLPVPPGSVTPIAYRPSPPPAPPTQKSDFGAIQGLNLNNGAEPRILPPSRHLRRPPSLPTVLIGSMLLVMLLLALALILLLNAH